jgi:hypothetical protein
VTAQRTGHLADATNCRPQASHQAEPPQAHHQEPPMGLVIVLIAILLAGTATSASLRRYV